MYSLHILTPLVFFKPGRFHCHELLEEFAWLSSSALAHVANSSPRATGAFVLTSPLCHRAELLGVPGGVCLCPLPSRHSHLQRIPSPKVCARPQASQLSRTGAVSSANLGRAHRIASFSAAISSSLSSDNVVQILAAQKVSLC